MAQYSRLPEPRTGRRGGGRGEQRQSGRELRDGSAAQLHAVHDAVRDRTDVTRGQFNVIDSKNWIGF